MKKYLELLFLNALPGFGFAKVNKNLSIVKSSTSIQVLADMIREKETKLSESDIRKALEKAKAVYDRYSAQKDLKIITILDREYPKGFRELKDKDRPVILYAKGDIQLLNQSGISVIGTREPCEFTQRLFSGLIKTIVNESGRVIVSGLALGCDALAHEEALNAGGKTVAILPCGVNKVVPVSNKDLAKHILENGGCLVSAYQPDEGAKKYTYTQRDKLIAAMTAATYVVQCTVKSGTLYTAGIAKDLSRVVACFVPSKDGYGDYSGNRYLIDEVKTKKVAAKEELSAFLSELKTDEEEWLRRLKKLQTLALENDSYQMCIDDLQN